MAFFVVLSVVVWSFHRPVVGAGLGLISSFGTIHRGNTGEALTFFVSGCLEIGLTLRGGEMERGWYSSSGEVRVANLGGALAFFVSES